MGFDVCMPVGIPARRKSAVYTKGQLDGTNDIAFGKPPIAVKIDISAIGNKFIWVWQSRNMPIALHNTENGISIPRLRQPTTQRSADWFNRRPRTCHRRREMMEVEVAAAVAFWLSDAKRAAQKIRHSRGVLIVNLPIADCRLPIADCRLPPLPIADCRFYGNGVCGQVVLVGLCHVFSFVLCQ